MFLNLSDALKYEPAIEHQCFVFNGGEPHLKINADSLAHLDLAQESVTITVQARSSNDLLLALLAQDALQRLGCSKINLFMPYFPAARQDRVMVPGEPLSVKVMARLINGAGFNRVILFDPHSEVTPALLDRCTVISNHTFIRAAMETIAALPHPAPKPPLCLIAPDAGAAKKIHHLAAALNWKHIVQCDKIRDISTGQLSGAQVFANDLQGADCLITDDICDGGGTFIQLAQALKAKNAGRLFLAVSHGIFSKGTAILTAHFDQIFTTNSFYTGASDDKVKVVACAKL